ncbi:solute carrier family 10 (sodium/bile acid cotransporter), member 7 [Xaviernesmea oryzae]|uniref:Solute carrier family 10 (Sodium/bile acid cotransporter), member 7 n=1 Tax=Xaviernesmea oryzae TaxID=464029 RepID=A0A1X7CZ41_9HYPH|nr:bile acid:sodium symporter family protein [Xaviernesmea oryzae]SMF05694.1 solute carrier family 10 (sodium/bile acid cotransporter), member 7 [Xaviernesmea oryzae]
MSRFLPDRFTVLLVCTVILASLLPIHGDWAEWFGIATDIAIGLLFFLHGARLSRDVVIAGILHWRLHLTILLVTFAVFPILGLAIGFIPEEILPSPLYAGILFLCVLPSTVQSSIAFTSLAGGNVPAAVCAASGSNILGMFLTPLLAGLLLSTTGDGGFSWDALESILLQLLAPFVVGQILQPWVGDWIRSKKKLLAPVDRGSILMVVYLAFSEAVMEGLWHTFSATDIAVVIVLDMALLAVVLCLTMFGSRALGFSKEDEITITFCGSKKSLASGVPMANAIFANQSSSVGAIVLPLMLFHQIQLMACAVIAQKYANRLKEKEAAAEPAAA